ncbi:MAG: ABC transporter permease [Coriobacteriia bacterium]|nr:ABC transporter permease [Coriobacteriia bacterium]
MLKYVARRILQMIPVFFGVTVILFILRAPGVLPGDPIEMLTGDRVISEVTYNQLVQKHGLDQPLYVQYVTYMKNLFKGDLGLSYKKNRSVTEIFVEKYPYTLRLALAAILIEMIVGLSVGIISAVKRYSFWDVAVTLSTSILVSLPVFWLGMLMQVLFGIYFKRWGLPYLPISGMGNPPDLAHLIMPAITLASVSTAYVARIMRSQMIDVSQQDYIRTAEAKGLKGGAVVRKHALKNALIPVVTFIGIDLGAMLAGAILTETVFNWPGIGYEIYLAITARDWPIVTGGVVIVVIAYMIINLLVDVSYAFLDPRIRYGGEAA